MQTQKEVAKVHSPRRDWGLAFGGLFWSVVAYLVPSVVVPFAWVGIDALSLDANAEMFVGQALFQLFVLAIVWLLLRQLYKWPLQSLGLVKLNLGMLGWSVLAFPLYLILSTLLSSIFAVTFGVDLAEPQDIGFSNPSGYELALIFVALVLLAPFVEEVLFRGFLFRTFRSFGFWPAAFGVSLVFAVVHWQVNVGIDVFVLSLFLCYLREKTDSLWPAIAMHSLKNLVAFVVLFIIGVS